MKRGEMRALAGIAALVPLAAPACASAPPAAMPASSPGALQGEPAPAFRRPTLAGGMFDSAEARGRVVVVKFFAQYCRPCQRTLPAAERLHRRAPDVMFVGIAEDDDPAAARAEVARHGLTFPVIHDAGNVLAGRFRVTEMPATFVLDRMGRVAWRGGPEQPDGALAQAIGAVGGGA
jgi:peroxiredoxin